MTQFYAYVYKNSLKNMEAFYVGKGCNDRAYDHLQKIKRVVNPHLSRTIQKMLREGNQPIIIIFNMSDEETAFDLEIDLIRFYGRKDLGMGSLLNLTDGDENPPINKMFGKDNPC